MAAYGLITDDNDSILLCRLTKPRRQVGWWTLPGGGLDFGEAPADAMVREVREETGFEVEPTDLVGVNSICVEGWSGEPMHGIRIVYRARIIGGALQHEVEGSTDLAQWWPRANVGSARLVDLVQEFLPAAFAASS